MPSQDKAVLSTEEEAGLVARAKEGDEIAISQLYRQYAPGIYGYIASRVGDSETAQDLTSEVFLGALEGLPKFEYRGIPFSAWVYRIAHDRIVDHYRRQGRRPTVPLEDEFLPAQDGIVQMADDRLRVERSPRRLEHRPQRCHLAQNLE